MKKQKKLPTIKFPYARLTGISGFMEYARQDGWEPAKIDIPMIKKMGIGTGKEGLVVSTVHFLKLIDDSGLPTRELRNLQEDYPKTLRRLVVISYKDLFSVIPAKLVNQHRLVSFFSSEGFSVETAEYQAKLFVWLCKEAGIELPSVEEKFHRARFDAKKAG
jgi:hypothetical protein